MLKTVAKIFTWLSFALGLVSGALFVGTLVQYTQAPTRDPLDLSPLIIAGLFFFSGMGFSDYSGEKKPPRVPEDQVMRTRRLRAFILAMIPVCFAIAFRSYFILVVALPLAMWVYLKPEPVEKLVAFLGTKFKTRKQP